MDSSGDLCTFWSSDAESTDPTDFQKKMLNGAYVGQSTPALLPSRSSETIREDPFAISGDSYIPNIPSPRPSLHRHKSFEIQSLTNLRTNVPGWDDDEVDEVMFITPKARRTRSLSVIHEDHEPPLACKSMDISAFNLLEPLDLNEHSETFISQDFACSTFYTVKTFSKKRLLKPGALDQVLMEQRILKHITELRIPFCTTLHWSFQNDEALYIVSDFFQCTLQQCIESQGPFSHQTSHLYAAELIEALSSLHHASILHGDMRPENVLLADDGHIVLTGFEQSRFTEPTNPLDCLSGFPTNEMSHLILQAPEVVLGWRYNFKTDLWSYGLLLFYMLSGLHPFIDEDPSVTHWSILETKILHAPMRRDREVGLDLLALDVIAHCLERNPAIRPTADQVKSFSYFSDIDWNEIREKISVPNSRPNHETNNQHDPHRFVQNTTCDRSTFSDSVTQTVGYIDGFDFTRASTDPNPYGPRNERSPTPLTGTQTSTTSSPGLRRTRRKTITSLSSSSSFSCTSLGELRLPPWKDLQPNGLEDGRFQSQGSMRTPVLGRTSPLDTPVSSEACTQGHNAMSDYFSVASLRDNSLAKGRLRKYASLDFELDTIVSLSQHSDTITTGTGGIYGRRSAEEGRGEIERRTKSVPLTSLPLWSPLKSFRFPRSQAQVLDLEATPSSGMTAGSPLSTQMNKLRKKMKPPLTDHLTATSATPSTQATSPAKPEPILGLPSGLEQIGHGIGYTFIRGSHAPPFPPRSNSNVATNKPSGETLTPRRAMSLRVFPSGSGPSRIILGDLKEKIFRKRKKSCISDTSTTEKGDKEGQGQEQDEMEAMMREMYGSTWDLNLGYHVSASSEPPPVPSSSYPPPIPKESNQIQQKDMDDVVLDITAGLGFGFGASAVDVNSLPGTPMTLQPSGSSSALSSGGAEGPGVAGTLIQGYGNGSLASGCLGMVSTLRLVPSPRVPDEIGS